IPYIGSHETMRVVELGGAAIVLVPSSKVPGYGRVTAGRCRGNPLSIRHVVDRFGPGVVRKNRESPREVLLGGELKRIIARVDILSSLRDAAKRLKRTAGVGRKLAACRVHGRIQLQRFQQMTALRADITAPDHPALAELAFHRKIPVVD